MPVRQRTSFGLIRHVFSGPRRLARLEAQQSALDRSQATIAFSPDGRILHANALFLDAMGYRLDEVRGQHHRLFMPPEERDTPAYRAFWDKLARGEFDAGQYRRRHKDGRDVWIQASYNPVLDRQGRVRRVLKLATDITAQKLRDAEVAGQLAAIDKAMAVIEFDLDGRILRANANFLAAMGYAESEVMGQHHSLFLAPGERDSADYARFWAGLRRGEFQSGQYLRHGKGGRRVWIEASYNPILDPAGRPFKVVKYATDITAQRARQADFEGQLAAIGRSQAVIEFDLDGHVLTANDNFLRCVGYTLEQVRGQHHRLYVPEEQRNAPDYRAFWSRLARGEAEAGQFRRIARDGREVWLQAVYSPILGADGKPYKVVKYATDVSAQVRLLADLKQLIADVESRAAQVREEAARIAAGNADLAGRTEEQAASLEETASSMEELTSNVSHTAGSAREAERVTAAAAAEARQGGEVVRSMVATMDDIRGASQRIGDIIGVIDGIAFQTNILALNAAVEAARAGEQGRGFAVVASEVRALAQRSADAAKDIKQLIQQSQATVDQGAARAQAAGGAVAGILAGVDEVSRLIREIAAAAAEQAAGLDQVNRTVMHLDDVTQQNGALVDQLLGAARSLDAQASALFEGVERFARENALHS